MPPRLLRRELVDRLLSGSAGLVAVTALVVSAYQAYLSREQQRMSAWPYVTQQNTGGDTSYAWRVVNAGVGPALVRRMTLTVDARPLHNWSEFFRTMLRADSAGVDVRLRGSNVVTSSIRRGSVLLPGSSTELVRVQGPFGGAERRLLNDPRVHIRVCYCSLFDDCWQSDSQVIEPERVDTCPVGADFES